LNETSVTVKCSQEEERERVESSETSREASEERIGREEILRALRVGVRRGKGREDEPPMLSSKSLERKEWVAATRHDERGISRGLPESVL